MPQPQIRDIACIGEAMVELSNLRDAPGTAQVSFAGDTFNTAYYMAQLLEAHPQKIQYFSALGTDWYSDRMVAFMQANSIGADHVARLPGLTVGLYSIQLDDDGERSFTYWRNAAAARQMLGVGGWSLDQLDAFAGVYVSGITLAILPEKDRAALVAKMAELRDAGRMVAFDSNYRPALWPDVPTAQAAMADAWSACNVALPSVDDEIALNGPQTAEQVCARIEGHGVREIILKRGAEGPLLLVDGKAETLTLPAVDNVTDSTAAGDSFNAGYMAARALGLSPAEAAAHGHATASEVIQSHGALISIDRRL